MHKIFLKVFSVLILGWAAVIFAQYGELNVEQEQRAQKIDRLLMAPCCWAKTVAEDSSGIAMQVKQQVRDLIRAGKSNQEVLAYFESEYGEKIFSSPKKENFNLLLWFLPFILMPVLILIVYQILRSWKKIPGSKNLNQSNASIQQQNMIKKSENEPIEKDEYDQYVSQLDQELYEK